MPQDPTPPERRPSEYDPPVADEVAQDDTVGTVGIVATGGDERSTR